MSDIRKYWQFLFTSPTPHNRNTSSLTSQSPPIINPASIDDPTSSSDNQPLLLFYTICTTVIILLGIIGNSLSIRRLVLTRMLHQPTSQFFVVLCICDILVLIFYVLPELFTRGVFGLTNWRAFQWNAVPGLCQTFLLFSYWMRLLSVWTLAAFSVHRCMNLKDPRSRKSRIQLRTLVLIFSISLLISLCKAYLTRSITSKASNHLICAPPPSTSLLNFIFDTTYAILVVIIPSLIIVCTNLQIAIRLYSLQSRISTNHNEAPLTSCSTPTTPRPSLPSPGITNDHTVHLVSSKQHHDTLAIQFSVLLLLISFSFILLSWPFSIVWVYNWVDRLNLKPTTNFNRNSSTDILYKINLLTRLLFYAHFAINLILYSVVTYYFKSKLKRHFTLKLMRQHANEFYDKTDLYEKNHK